MRRTILLALVALGVAGATATALVGTDKPEECSPAMDKSKCGMSVTKSASKDEACPHSCSGKWKKAHTETGEAPSIR